MTFVLIFLSACGFQPIYGAHGSKGSPVGDALSEVAIANIPDRPGQIMKNDLIDRMYGKSGRPASPRYKLEVKLQSGEQDLGLQADATTSRAMLNTSADYVLKDMSDKVLFKGTAHSVTSFNTLDQQFGTQAAHDSAVQRTIDEASNQIVNAISLYFAEKAAN